MTDTFDTARLQARLAEDLGKQLVGVKRPSSITAQLTPVLATHAAKIPYYIDRGRLVDGPDVRAYDAAIAAALAQADPLDAKAFDFAIAGLMEGHSHA